MVKVYQKSLVKLLVNNCRSLSVKSNFLFFLLYIKQCDGISIFKQQIISVSVENVVIIRGLYFFGNFIFEIFDYNLMVKGIYIY